MNLIPDKISMNQFQSYLTTNLLGSQEDLMHKKSLYNLALAWVSAFVLLMVAVILLQFGNVTAQDADDNDLDEDKASAVEETNFPGDQSVVNSVEDCLQYENYAGAEPEGYAQYCVEHEPQPMINKNLDQTDLAFAQDIGFVSDNFVSHMLNDFPGQTVIGSNARPLFAMDFDRTGQTLYAIDNTSRELGTYDLTSGAFITITTVSGIPVADNISGLTIDPQTGTAYVSGLSTEMTLYTMDLATGVATTIGSDPTVTLLIDIAIGPQGIIYGHDIGTDSIYTIDKTTGAATLVGLTGVDSNFAQGMDFDNTDGTLYAYTYQGGGANQYGTIDLATGAFTPLAIDNPTGEFEGATQTAFINIYIPIMLKP